jgi:hypothetical protein
MSTVYSPRWTSFVHWTYSVHVGESVIRAWICDDCGYEWPKSDKAPLRCAKCRSRRWNQGGPTPEPAAVKPPSIPNPLRAIIPPAVFDDPEPEFDLCPYKEYDSESGETYRCRLPVGHKVKHQRGEIV